MKPLNKAEWIGIIALESAIRTYESMSPGVITVEHKQAIEALQALQSGEPVAEVTMSFGGYKVLRWLKTGDLDDYPEGTKFYTTPQPVVPEAKVWNQAEGRDGKLYADGWNACRDAMCSHPDGTVEAYRKGKKVMTIKDGNL